MAPDRIRVDDQVDHVPAVRVALHDQRLHNLRRIVGILRQPQGELAEVSAGDMFR